ncbi:MAG: serine/threonine protein phosphatase [Magnetococcales bacterium]|nr:serine/threonine protein phosphatase [Magnetococcales bacterium]
MFKKEEEEVLDPTLRPPPQKAKVPDGYRVYVIGDIHGRLDLLNILHERIDTEVRQLDAETKKVVVYLGDYIDRGNDSAGVVDLLINNPIAGCESIFLKGNHEAEMDDFLAKPEPNHLWTRCGGAETALSYKVRVKAQISAEARTQEMRDRLLEAIPKSHREFYDNLRLNYEIGDYFMVHAGVRPQIPLKIQTPNDLLWIREPFLSYNGQFEKVIVHGHTMIAKPITLPNRIGIDTGAYHSGKLTCLILEKEDVRFMIT